MAAPPMNWTLEMVPLPVSDMDSAVHFYSEKEMPGHPEGRPGKYERAARTQACGGLAASRR